MDFTRLNLKEYLTEGITTSNNLATNAEQKTSDLASTTGKDKQHDPGRREMQLKQRTARTGPTHSTGVVDVGAQPKVAESFMNQKKAIEFRKMFESSKTDWRAELAEAINPDDDPEHPYVEIMPHYKYKEKEAKKNAGKAAMKDRANGEPPLRTGVNEESTNSKADAKKRRQNLTIEAGMRRRQANPVMPKPNLDYAQSDN